MTPKAVKPRSGWGRGYRRILLIPLHPVRFRFASLPDLGEHRTLAESIPIAELVFAYRHLQNRMTQRRRRRPTHRHRFEFEEESRFGNLVTWAEVEKCRQMTEPR